MILHHSQLFITYNHIPFLLQSPYDTSPFAAMRREKTVVDVDVSDEQKQAMYSALMRQQQQAESKRAQQMMRQEEMVSLLITSLCTNGFFLLV